jgi:hypothetical protein
MDTKMSNLRRKGRNKQRRNKQRKKEKSIYKRE